MAEKKVITPSKPSATIKKAEEKKQVKAAPKASAKPAAKAPVKAAPTAKATTKPVTKVEEKKPASKPAKKDVKQIVPSKPAATIAKAKEREENRKADGSNGNKKIYHVSKREKDGREWKIFIQGSDKVIKLCDTQEEALKIAKTFAKNDGNATVILHGLDGKIRKY